MKKLNCIITIACCFCFSLEALHAQIAAPAIDWQKTIGTNTPDELVSVYAVKEVNAWSYYAIGHTSAGVSGDKTHAAKGDEDFWIVKLDANGHIVWDRSYGGSGIDKAEKALVYDGHILIGGQTSSKDGDISDTVERGNFPNPLHTDIWLVYTDAAGNIIWDKRYGTSGSNRLTDIVRVQNGYVFVTNTPMEDGDRTLPRTADWRSTWLVKIDNNGNKVWERAYGAGQVGAKVSEAVSMIATKDGGLLVLCNTENGIMGDKTDTARGGVDLWLLKLDANGQLQWDKTIGSPNNDDRYIGRVVETSDGHYLLSTMAYGGVGGDKTSPFVGGASNIWVVKFNQHNILWDKTFGSSTGIDGAWALVPTNDGGAVILGESFGGINVYKSEPNRGLNDYWLLRVDSNGQLLWDKTLGGDNDEYPRSIVSMGADGFIVGGISASGVSGDKSDQSKGDFDFWLLKLSAEQGANGLSEMPAEVLTCYPNPAKEMVHFSADADVRLYNIQGQLLEESQAVTSLNIAHLAKGAYVIQYKTPSGFIWQHMSLVKE